MSNEIRLATICFFWFVISLSSTFIRAEQVTISIRLVNGKNGRPITDENLNIFVNGSRFARNYRPNGQGLIELTVDSNDTIALVSNIQVTCHPYTRSESQIRQ